MTFWGTINLKVPQNLRQGSVFCSQPRVLLQNLSSLSQNFIHNTSENILVCSGDWPDAVPVSWQLEVEVEGRGWKFCEGPRLINCLINIAVPAQQGEGHALLNSCLTAQLQFIAQYIHWCLPTALDVFNTRAQHNFASLFSHILYWWSLWVLTFLCKPGTQAQLAASQLPPGMESFGWSHLDH